jgi:hypothetical protein
MTSCGADILLVVAQHKFGGTGRVEEARGNPEHDRPAPHILFVGSADSPRPRFWGISRPYVQRWTPRAVIPVDINHRRTNVCLPSQSS